MHLHQTCKSTVRYKLTSELSKFGTFLLKGQELELLISVHFSPGLQSSWYTCIFHLILRTFLSPQIRTPQSDFALTVLVVLLLQILVQLPTLSLQALLLLFI